MMNWNYLQQWAMSLIFFAPALVILALAVLAMPLGKANRYTREAEKQAEALKGRGVAIHVKQHHVPPGETVAEETA